jgi:uncharacterized protein YlaI
MERSKLHNRPAARMCPHCHSPAVARSRVRGGLLGRTAGRLFGIRAYRCLDCWHRFFASARGGAAHGA